MLRLLGKKPIRLRVRIAADFTGLDRLQAALTDLTDNPVMLERLLQQAVADTLLESWRKRFLDRLPDALNMERVSESRSPATGPELALARQTLAEASRELTQAQLDGQTTASAKRKVAKAERALMKVTAPRGGPGALSTGQFRPLALQVLRVLSEVSASTQGDTVSIGLGHLPTLEAIKTPSATPMLTGHDTGSAFNTLWKHLEFGTGAYASNRAWNAGAPTRLASGGWWYGPRKGFGIQLKGSKGVHAIVDPATGVPYMQDALRFEHVFDTLLTKKLLGK
jgi:hypothetical protein